MRELASLSRRALAAFPLAALAGTIPLATAAAARAAASDPVFAEIAQHQALRDAIGRTSGLDDDPAYVTACKDEEAALQALGDLLPASIAGAATLLTYMAEAEGDFADPGSPLLRTVLSVAAALSNLGGSNA